jgi:hypothetical protein
MIGEYVRVTPEVMEHAIADPQWALEYIEQLQDAADFAEFGGEDEAEEPQPPKELMAQAQARLYSTYKAWNILAFLLHRAGCPVDVVYGEVEFAEEEDWGYGPPRYLPPDRVRDAAQVLQGYTFAALSAGVTDQHLRDAEVYPIPDPSSGNDEVMWAEHWFQPLVDFFAAAASEGDAVIVWLD